MPDSYLTKIRIDQARLWKGKAPLLSTLDMELTERCNLNCIHCYINQPADKALIKKQEISTETIKAALSEAASLGCLSVRFTGGEPLLREDFSEIYLFSRKLGLKVRLFTNATLVTPDLVEILGRIPPLEKIEITVYGMNKKSCEAITRTPGSFKAAFDGIHLLQRHQIPFKLTTIVLPPNEHELMEFETLAKSLSGIDEPPGYTFVLNLRARRDSHLKNRSIKLLRMSPAEGMKIITRQGESYRKEIKALCAGFMAPADDGLFPCGAGAGGGCVDAYGILQPCLLLRHPDTVYDLTNGSLRDALTGFFPEIRRLKATHPEYLLRCARCFLKGLCEQCPAKSWMEHGTLDTPVEYCCALAHAQAEYLDLLRPGEKAWEIPDWRARIKSFTDSPHPDKTSCDPSGCRPDGFAA